MTTLKDILNDFAEDLVGNFNNTGWEGFAPIKEGLIDEYIERIKITLIGE